MASIDMCEHEWPGSGCKKCKEESQMTEERRVPRYEDQDAPRPATEAEKAEAAKEAAKAALYRVSPWQPITDPLHLKLLGKLLEELNEAGSAAARCLIQGMDGAEPDTGKVNREWLEDELADVMANISLVAAGFEMDWDRMNARIARKRANLQAWHAMGAEAAQ